MYNRIQFQGSRLNFEETLAGFCEAKGSYCERSEQQGSANAVSRFL